jgi:hypothetical protein
MSRKMIQDALVGLLVLVGTVGGAVGLLTEMKRPWPVQAAAPETAVYYITASSR